MIPSISTIAHVWLAATLLFLAGWAGAFYYMKKRVEKWSCFPSPKRTTDNVIAISGCDTGFGYMTTLQMARKGFHVFATVLQEASIEKLEEESRSLSGKVTCCQMNISKEEDIAKASKVLEDIINESGGRKQLVGVVNNAGIAVAGPIECVSMDRWRLQIDVNTIGHVTFTNYLLPLLRKSKHGRIVNIVSIAGRYVCEKPSAMVALNVLLN